MGLPALWYRTGLAQQLCCTSAIQRPSTRSCPWPRSRPVNMRWWCWPRCSAHTQNIGGWALFNYLTASLRSSKADLPWLLQVQDLSGELHLLPGSGGLPPPASASHSAGQGTRRTTKTSVRLHGWEQRGGEGHPGVARVGWLLVTPWSCLCVTGGDDTGERGGLHS